MQMDAHLFHALAERMAIDNDTLRAWNVHCELIHITRDERDSDRFRVWHLACGRAIKSYFFHSRDLADLSRISVSGEPDAGLRLDSLLGTSDKEHECDQILHHTYNTIDTFKLPISRQLHHLPTLGPAITAQRVPVASRRKAAHAEIDLARASGTRNASVHHTVTKQIIQQ